MIKIFCDHCGKEIDPMHIFKLDVEDFIYSMGQSGKLVGCTLCEDCYSKRASLHVKLDAEFLHRELEKENGKSNDDTSF